MTEPTSTKPLLEVRDLRIDYASARTTINAVRGISFDLAAGETVAVVGESGSGKSTTAAALVRLLPRSATITGGSIRFAGTDVLESGGRAARALLGRRIGYVPQDPSVSLNPVVRVGDQVAEVLLIHKLADRRTAHISAVEALAGAGIDRPEERARQYPHELSGGQRQRVLIAIAIAARPALVIADEPTSALDVTVQRRILDHFGTLTKKLGASVLLVTHDLGVAADRADRILVLSRGELVEHGTPDEILGAPKHPYTRSLIAAAPSLHTVGGTFLTRARGGGADAAPAGPPLIEGRNLVKDFAAARSGSASVPAVDDVSLAIHRGRTLSLVGESGSGKTTTARLVLRLVEPTSGSILFDGADITGLRGEALRQLRRRVQVVYQNPFQSLDPRLSVGRLVSEPLHSLAIGSRPERRARAAELLDLVGLPSSFVGRKPAELSGGQRQRVAIARALAVAPDLVVLDEPVSALDVRVQAQILALLASVQADLGVAYLFISHDLAVVRQVSHDVGVMSLGQLVEQGPTDAIFDDPQHDYTRELLDAIPGGARFQSPIR
jgi:peptide/nickel transport system ATP-binding protein